jgi:hypothetical protein
MSSHSFLYSAALWATCGVKVEDSQILIPPEMLSDIWENMAHRK